MKLTIRTALTAAALAMAAQFSTTLPAHAIGTAFTYQGELSSSGSTYTGTADVQFKLFNASSGGSQVGSTQTATNLNVSNGRFTASVDFGSVFDGTNLWLEIAVRAPAGGGSYTTLSSGRQPLTATPYALYAASSAQWKSVGNAIQNANTGFVGIGRTARVSNAELFGMEFSASGYGGMYIQGSSASALPFYGYSVNEGGSSAWTYYDGSNWYVHNNGDQMTVTSTGRVGIGDTTPAARLSVAGGTLKGINVNSSGDSAITASSTSDHAIVATTTAAFSYGVSGTGTSAGVYGHSGASDGAGVLGDDGTQGGTGVWGQSSATGGAGVAGYANFGTGVYGQTANGYGVYGSSAGGSGYAGYFNGKTHVDGTFSATTKNFKIDHPLDPANMFLVHTSVESPDMKDLYDGVVTLEADGSAVVTLPGYFESLNKDFRYQLTCMGGWAPVYIAEEVSEHHFKIAGGKAGMKVSWMLTGVRHDAWANANRAKVEIEKSADEKGKYLNPEAFGMPESMRIDHSDRASKPAALK